MRAVRSSEPFASSATWHSVNPSGSRAPAVHEPLASASPTKADCSVGAPCSPKPQPAAAPSQSGVPLTNAEPRSGGSAGATPEGVSPA
ncbi:MAG: hypothetical protein VXY90_13535, partial [Pseudomonadota bacterium]|nr:hypothetical protein [Pseudomonadota bacterium]